jgi:DNA polymerase III epsilon subunit-like protein
MNNTTAHFDIETNAIKDWSTLSDLHTVHCMVVINSEGVHRFRADSMEEGLKLLSSHNTIVGHNAIGFDYPALNKLYKFRHPSVVDTVVLARCIYPDLRNDDFKRQDFPKELIGSHSLKAWGKRIGEYKDDHGETEDWSTWSKEMEDYCVQDVRVTQKLFDYLLRRNPSAQMVDLEMRFAMII